MEGSPAVRPSAYPLLDHASIIGRIGELAAEISRDYSGREPVLLIVLKGGLFIGAELASRLTIPARIEFARARSYDGTRAPGAVTLSHLPEGPIEGREVAVVEDILDTGRTLAALLTWLRALKPAHTAVCTLLDKPARREAAVDADYVGFTIPDRFVVGFGLDYEERYRTLPAIHVLETG